MTVIGFVSSFISQEPSPRPAVEFAIEHGFHAVELTGRHYWPDLLDARETAWLVDVAAEHEITYTFHFAFDAVPASHHVDRRAEWLQKLLGVVELAGALHAPVIVLHPGQIDCPGVEPERATEPLRSDAADNLVRFLSEIAGPAESAGTSICLENLHHRQGDVIRSYAHLVDVVERVDSPAVRITLDVGHAAIHDGIPGAIEAFGPLIGHLHLDDARDGIDHLEVGRGDIDMDEYAGLIGPDGPRTATLEVADADDPHGCILRSRDVLRRRFGELIG